jgi:hypothetical protein
MRRQGSISRSREGEKIRLVESRCRDRHPVVAAAVAGAEPPPHSLVRRVTCNFRGRCMTRLQFTSISSSNT